jgi:hypothetical protein
MLRCSGFSLPSAAQMWALRSPSIAPQYLNLINADAAFSGGEQAQFASDVSANVTGGQDYFQDVYAASEAVEIPEDADPWLREFIELGNEAHNYSRAMRLTHNIAAPDVSQAVMVGDSH